MDLQKSEIKLSTKLGYMFYGLGGTSIHYFRSYYYMFFLTDVLYLNMQFAGMIVAIGTIWDAINDLLIGYLVSKHVFKNGEQLKPYSVFILPLALNTVLMFSDFPVEQKLKGTIALILYLLYSVFFTFYTAAQNNVALVTKSEEERLSINTFTSFGTTLGSAIGALTCLPLLKWMGAMNKEGNLQDGSKFVWTAAIICGVSAAAAMVYFFTVKEKYHYSKEQAEELKFFDGVKFLIKERMWINNFLQLLMLTLCTKLVNTNLTYYATYQLHRTDIVTSILAVNTICSVAVYAFIKPIKNKLGKSKTLYLSFAILVLGKIVFALFPGSILSAYINVASIGVGTGLGQFVLFTNRNEIADVVQAKHNVRVDGMVSTTITFGTKLAGAIAVYLSSALLEKVGYDGSLAAQSSEVLNMLNSLMGWIPLVFMVVIIFATIDYKKA